MTSDEEDTAPSQEQDAPNSRWRWFLRWVVLPLVVVAAIVGALLYVERASGPSEGGAEGIVALPSEKNPTGEEASPQVGSAAPDFLLKTVDGQAERLSDYQGHPVVVNFWATWCPECRDETPQLVKAYSLYGDQGLVILGVDVKESDAQVRPFAEEFGMDYPIVMDLSGEVTRAYHATGVPETYFIDRTGVIRAKFVGPLQWTDLEQYLQQIM